MLTGGAWVNRGDGVQVWVDGAEPKHESPEQAEARRAAYIADVEKSNAQTARNKR